MRTILVRTAWNVGSRYVVPPVGEFMIRSSGDPPTTFTFTSGEMSSLTTVCTAQATLRLSSRLEQDFQALSRSELPEGARSEAEIDKSLGYSLPFDLYPEHLRQFLSDTGRYLNAAASVVARLVRWRTDSTLGSHRPFDSFLRSEWSWDGETWLPLPFRGSGYVKALGAPRLDERARASVQEMLEHGVREPVSEELLREAEAQATPSPRSALLLAVAAVEVGFKELVAALVPDAAWLAMEVPSPPLGKMLKEYLPLLPVLAGAPAAPPPKPFPRILDDAVQRRNTLAHSGAEPPTHEELEALLDCVHTILRQFAYYRGQTWARSQWA